MSLSDTVQISCTVLHSLLKESNLVLSPLTYITYCTYVKLSKSLFFCGILSQIGDNCLIRAKPITIACLYFEAFWLE